MIAEGMRAEGAEPEPKEREHSSPLILADERSYGLDVADCDFKIHGWSGRRALRMVLTGAAAMDATESGSESHLECGDSSPLSDFGRGSVVAGVATVRRGGSFEVANCDLQAGRRGCREQEGK
jgi:hypothetical protein